MNKNFSVKKSEGSSLTEVLLAVVLLVVMGTLFFTIIGKQYYALSTTKKNTEDYYTAGQKTERDIFELKDKIYKNESLATYTQKEIQIFKNTGLGVNGIKIPYFEIENNIMRTPNADDTRNKKIVTFIGNQKREVFEAPKIESVKNKIFEVRTRNIPAVAGLPNTITETINPITTYAKKPQVKIDSETILESGSVAPLSTLYQWYMSREGYNIMMDGAINSDLYGTAYPVYPGEYEVIPGQNKEKITDIKEEYAGKHLVLTAKPAADSGKIGSESISTPIIYLSGLPHMDNLIAHLDASIIPASDYKKFNNQNVLHKWKDLTENNNDAYVNNVNDDNNKPILKISATGERDIPGLGVKQISSQYVTFKGVNDFMTIFKSDQTTKGIAKTNDLTVFVVARNNSTTNISLISKNYQNFVNNSAIKFFNLDYSDFHINLGATAPKYTLGNPTKNNWHIFGFSTKIDLLVDKNNIGNTNQNITGLKDENPILIGKNFLNNNVGETDIAEIIVYNRELTNQEMIKIRDYLIFKYGFDFS